MTSVCDTDEGFDRLINALKEIDGKCRAAKHPTDHSSPILPQKRFTISEALSKDGETLPIDRAEGEVSREYIRVYPPGVPLIVPGEVIHKDVLSRITLSEASGNEILTDSSSYPLISIIS